MSENQSAGPEHAVVTPHPQSVEGLFVAALGHASPQERETFLNEACGDDADRRRRVEALLRAYDDAGSFLEHPPIGTTAIDSFNLDFLTPSGDPSLLGLLGPYEVYEVLGRGGMGIVLRARDPKLNRVVAIKVLAPELAANPLARRRFLREAQAAAAISHPHVVTIHAVDEGVASGGCQPPDRGGSPSASNSASHASGGSHPPLALPYLVMECIVGQTLQQKLDKQGSLRLTETLRIGQQVAEGLAAAHRQGLIHRDIKPANVLLENGVERVKITDFGLARLVDDVSITRTGEVSGTPQYMSPEQAGGEPVDHRSDLFSLGCVLYAMCTGRSPFRATSLAAAIRRTCDETPRPIQEINPETPAWLTEIINQLLEKNPDERIQSAEEVSDRLSAHLSAMQRPMASTDRIRPSIRNADSPNFATPGTTYGGRQRISTGSRQLAWLLALVSIACFSFAAAKLFAIPDQFISLAALALGVVAFFALVDWREAGIFASVNRLLVAILCLVTFWIAGVGGAPDGGDWFRFYEKEFVAGLVTALGLAASFLALLVSRKSRHRGDTTSRDHRSSPQDIRKTGRTAIWSGIAVTAAPWLPIGFGWLVGNGDPMEFGGRLVFPAAILGVLTIIMGCVALLVAYSVAQRHPERDVVHRPWHEWAHAGGKGPWSVLGWLLVVGLVLIPILFVVSLMVTIGAYRSAELERSARRAELVQRIATDTRREVEQEAEQRRQEAARRATPPDIWNAAATATFRFDPTALGDVGIAMARVDATIGRELEESQVLIRAGDMRASYPLKPTEVNEIKVPPGRYGIWVIGREFGWAARPGRSQAYDDFDMGMDMGMDIMDMDMMGMAGGIDASGDSAVSKVADAEIREGDDPQTVILAYDWRDIASRPPRWHDSSASRDFYWNGDTYSVNWAQAQVIQKLLVAFAAGAPDVHQALLTVEFGPVGMMGMMSGMGGGFDMMGMMGGRMSPSEDGRALRFFEDIFEKGQHRAWGTLIVPGQTAGTYRLAVPIIPPPPASESGSESSTSEPFLQQEPPTFPNQPDAAPQAFPQGREGVLNIDIRDDGLVVAIRRISAFGGFVPGTEQQIADVGLNPLQLSTGQYEVLIRDAQFGWGDRKQTIFVGREMTELIVQRNLLDSVQRDGAERSPLFLWSTEPFRWNGEVYAAPSWAARLVVNWLLAADVAGEPEVEEQILLKRLSEFRIGGFGKTDSVLLKPERLADVFDVPQDITSRQYKPAWGNLIVPGEKEGTYRLKPVPRGTLKVTVVDDGMLATVRPADPQADVDPRTIAGDGTQSWVLPPGEYQVAIADSRVGWQFFSPNATVRTETVSVTEGETTDVRVDRRFTDYVEVPKPDSGFFLKGLLFRWFPQGSLAGSNVTPDQAACISVLLQALTDGKPEVAEAEILKKARLNAESLEDVFNDIAAAWSNLIVPGKTEGTWRLKPTPKDATGAATTRGDEPVDAVRPREDDLPPGETMGHATLRAHCDELVVISHNRNVDFNPRVPSWGLKSALRPDGTANRSTQCGLVPDFKCG